MDRLLGEVLIRITPTEGEQKREAELVAELMGKLKKLGASPILVGSNAKDTDLSGDKDIDLFIQFPAKTKRETLEKKGLTIGKKFFKAFNSNYEIDYAEHPYVKGVYRGYEIEIVPCYRGAAIMSSVDRTPFHTEYVKKKLREKPGLKGEVRLLKQFMKGVGVYGAEAKVQGFSGYLVEVLVIHFGSFKKTLKAASGWGVGEVFDPESLWEDADSLRYYFTGATLIVVDPVDRDRNVAAAVSEESLARFIAASNDFLKKPQEEFFFPKPKKPKTLGELRKRISEREAKIIAFSLKHEKLNENSLYSQLRRTEASIKKTFEKNEFTVFKSGFWTNEEDTSIIIFMFEVAELPPVMHHLGPPIDLDASHQERFREKHAKHKPYILDGRWVADIKRKVTKVEDLIPTILADRDGFGKTLRDAKTRTQHDEKILAKKDREYLIFLDEMLG